MKSFQFIGHSPKIIKRNSNKKMNFWNKTDTKKYLLIYIYRRINITELRFYIVGEIYKPII